MVQGVFPKRGVGVLCSYVGQWDKFSTSLHGALRVLYIFKRRSPPAIASFWYHLNYCMPQMDPDRDRMMPHDADTRDQDSERLAWMQFC